MVLVAVAGGTSPTLGKSLVTAILATGKHDVLILSRKPEKDEVCSRPTSVSEDQMF
jgi:NAD dependent epimerase/dehydratase family enzyme